MPLIKDKKLREEREAMRQQARDLYATGDYSIASLARHLRRGPRWVFEAIHEKKLSTSLPLTKGNKKGKI